MGDGGGVAGEALLVVCADDLGVDSVADTAIAALAEAGAVTHATLLVNGGGGSAGPEVAAAAAAAVGRHAALGLHLNLTEGSALTGASSLTSARGRMLGKFGLRAALLAGRVALADVARETEAQLLRFEGLVGECCRHLDGHQHVHVLPSLAPTLARVAAAHGVRSVRLPTAMAGEEVASRFLREVAAQAAVVRTDYAALGICSSAAFLGLSLMGSGCAEAAANALRRIANGGARTAEWMTHPGRAGAGDRFSTGPARAAEHALLLDPALGAAVRGAGFRLASWAEVREREGHSERGGTEEEPQATADGCDQSESKSESESGIETVAGAENGGGRGVGKRERAAAAEGPGAKRRREGREDTRERRDNGTPLQLQ